MSIWPFMLLIAIVLGAIWGGIATPSEAAAFGATGALLINLIYGRLTWDVLKDLPDHNGKTHRHGSLDFDCV